MFDFQVENTTYDTWDDEKGQDNNKFLVKMFGMDEKGKTYCIYVKGFQPFFYVLVPDSWKTKEAVAFKQWIKMQLDERFENSVTYCKIKKGKKLYGFDNFKDYKFLEIGFKNVTVLNKVKKLWYHDNKDFKKRRLKKKGVEFEKDVFIRLYEGRITSFIKIFSYSRYKSVRMGNIWSFYKKSKTYHKKNKL